MYYTISDDKQTFAYKTIKNVTIEVDVYEPFAIAGKIQEPSNKSNSSSPRVLLFIHGGAWIAGNRFEYPQPLFWEFRQRGYHIASADYRLLPESPFIDGQLEDIRDLEPWLRDVLPRKLGFSDIISNIIVAGSSAGALLALLTVIPAPFLAAPTNLRYPSSPPFEIILPALTGRRQNYGTSNLLLSLASTGQRICTTFHFSTKDCCRSSMSTSLILTPCATFSILNHPQHKLRYTRTGASG